MGDKLFKKRAVELYNQSEQENVENLPLGCSVDIKGNLERCRSENFLPEDSFIIKKDDADVTKYSEDYTVTQSIIPCYVEINKKSRGECCPFYEHKCRFVLDAVFRDVYGEDCKI